MPRLPRVSGQKVVRALQKAGFRVLRITGDHAFLVNEQTGRRTVVGVSAGTLPVGTLASVLRQAGLSVGEFRGLLK
jgi:predicted RNA binding protein YcfA (HicA-like mRNA interferase family)